MRRLSDSRWQPADLRWTDAGVTLVVDEEIYFSPFIVAPNGEADAYASLANLAKEASRHGIDLKGCASCFRFRFSGMAHQFSGGKQGYCTLVGFRNQRGIVSIDHSSGEHTTVPDWPSDLDAAERARLELSAREPKPSRLNAFSGAIIGLAAGDALGVPVELLTREQIVSTFGPLGITGFDSYGTPAKSAFSGGIRQMPRPGTYSNDTRLGLAVAEALIEHGDENLEILMQSLVKHFLEWSHSADDPDDRNRTSLVACRNLAAGVPWTEAGQLGSKGCSSCTRAAPIGLYFWRDHKNLLDVARSSSIVTHRHDAAVESAAAVALLVGLALEKKTPSQMYVALMEECAPRSADFKSCIESLPSLVTVDPSDALSARGIGEGWIAEEAVASALYCFWRSPDDFEQTVLTAVNINGNSDSIACIAGAIAGAFNGLAAIPTAWIDAIENSQGLRDLAKRIWETTSASKDV